ncbi:hypothetical protein NIES4101_45790 [Calothrix sp. NIES-4101]|nr:hypothetical protein NIES4101_45790 [Calothrix sp. NIES-4101]
MKFKNCVRFLVSQSDKSGIITPRIINLRHFIAAFIVVIITVFLIKYLFLLGFQKQIQEQMAYAFRYWYSPLIHNLDLFICGFLINPLIQYYNQDKKSNISTKISKDSKNKLHLFRFNSLNYPRIKFIAIILIVLLYLFTAHHGYHQELFGLPSRPSGIRTFTTTFILQPLTAIITSFFIFTFELKRYELYSQNEKLSFNNILKNPIRTLEIMGNLSYGVYVWHIPIIQKITPVFTSDIPLEAFALRISATLILSSILATVTYYLVEIPAAKFKIYQGVRIQN